MAGDVAGANEAASVCSASGVEQQQAGELCCLCKKYPPSLFCTCGVGYCAACIEPVKGLKRDESDRCKICFVASRSVLQRIGKPNGKGKSLQSKADDIQVAANFLVDAAHQGAVSTVNLLLGPMLAIVADQLKQSIVPCFTAAQMMCLIGRSDTCTDRLLRTIAQAHADLARHRAIGPWRPEPIVQSVTSSTRRIAYLAGGVTRGVLQASSVLQNHNLKKVEVWLIIRCSEDQCDDDVGSHAVQEFVNSGRLLRLNPTTSDQEQAESIRKLGLDVMFLICPPEGFESILARHPACNLVN